MPNTSLTLIGTTVAHSLWIGGLFAAGTAIAMHLLRDAPPIVRYRIASSALAAVVVVPLLVLLGDSGSHGWMPWLGLAWAAGASVLGVRLVNSLRQVRRLRQSAWPAPARWQNALTGAAAALGINTPVRLEESDLIEVPCSLGVRRPAILMPSGMLSRLSPEAFRAIAAHELAHVARRDYLWNLVQAALETMLFFHPVTGWLSRSIRRERELCCDAAASSICEPLALAHALAALEDTRAQSTIRVTASAEQPLLDRVRQLVSPAARSRMSAVTASMSVAALVVIGGATAFAILSATGIAAAPATSRWLPWLTATGLGLLVGLRHALEPDHLVAVATLVTRERDARAAVRLGAAWGAGHTIALLALGTVLVVARWSLPTAVGSALEGLVAVMIIVMGLVAVRDGVRMSAQGPRLAHRHGGVRHIHPTAGAHMHIGPLAIATRPLVIGMVHGLAGSGALTALALASLPSWPEQVGYMLVFGLGSTAGMAAAAGLAGWHLTRFVRTPAALGALSVGTGCVAVAAGVAWAIPLLAG